MYLLICKDNIYSVKLRRCMNFYENYVSKSRYYARMWSIGRPRSGRAKIVSKVYNTVGFRSVDRCYCQITQNASIFLYFLIFTRTTVKTPIFFPVLSSLLYLAIARTNRIAVTDTVCGSISLILNLLSSKNVLRQFKKSEMPSRTANTKESC